MSHVQEFFRMPPSERDHIPAFRIALGVAIPLLTLLFIDRLDLAVYAAFGAFTGIYARFESPRSRLLRQSIAGTVLVGCVAIGALLSTLQASMWVMIAVTALVSGAGAAIALRWNLKPGGSIFFVFATSALASSPDSGPVPVAVAVAGASACVSILLGAVAHLVGERMPPGVTTHLVFPTRGDLLAHAARFTVAPLLAGLAGGISTGAHPLLTHSYWSMVAAVALITPPHRSARIKRGMHRMVGTLGGLVVTAFLLSFPNLPWQLVVWVIILQFLAEVFVLRHYSMALLFITPLALLMTQLGMPQPVPGLLISRAVETAIGVLVGVLVVIFGFPEERFAAAAQTNLPEEGPAQDD